MMIGALLATVALSACHATPSAPPMAAPSIQSIDCTAWRVLAPGGRAALLTRFEAFFGAPVDGSAGHGPVLVRTDATALFDNYCSQPFAAGFKLYKLYGRAAAFA